MATHAGRLPTRPSHKVTFSGSDTIHLLSPPNGSLSVPATPLQPTVHYPDTQLHAIRAMSTTGLGAQQWYGLQQHSFPVASPAQYAQPAYPANYISHYPSGHAEQYGAYSVNQYAAGPGTVGGFVGMGDRSDVGHGCPPPTTHTPISCPAPLLANLSLPSTPSETPLSRSPQSSPPRTLQDSPRPQSSSSWGTPSPEPDARAGRDSDVSPHLQKFALKWDVRGDRLKSLDNPPWFSEPAFRSGRTSCELSFKADSERWSIQVPESRRGRALTVWDVLCAIDTELWEELEAHDFYKGHPRFDDAKLERSYRHLGDQDRETNTFRSVDFFPEDGSDFLGLKEDVEKRPGAFIVVIGSTPSP
ncbi:hypothetical protein BD309DRAFT_1078161 [Dichomitus squalens]|uniref:DUF6699 domain-containing protein n=2 Tax=Dichomitus squalens TaxID=114155 RepID=A0A4Q9P1W6_9APHY|nr:uncharacterized protein DICSQDRAFT_140844 [Dichomitus squalens LYAD-421 SS1]EJF56911.1 hypothetical protein DICSQDRAFT_140844 [Dichomitus squalens LYAD-421 SS1]TBU47107.1 hypothetical protein BD309DRAFT_1078161 [Dichomitus squalens]TBU60775.1 hypothetical protein BD310DRAFT_874715 [Dichomitus squalens]